MLHLLLSELYCFKLLDERQKYQEEERTRLERKRAEREEQDHLR